MFISMNFFFVDSNIELHLKYCNTYFFYMFLNLKIQTNARTKYRVKDHGNSKMDYQSKIYAFDISSKFYFMLLKICYYKN